MTVVVEWMDGVERRYDGAEQATVGDDRVLRVYGYAVGGRTPILAELPIYGIREIKREGRS